MRLLVVVICCAVSPPSLSLSMALQPFGLRPFFSVSESYTQPVGLLWHKNRLHAKLCLLHVSCRFLAWVTLRPLSWGRYVPPKRRLTFNGPQGVIFQKTGLFRPTVVRTSQPITLVLSLLHNFAHCFHAPKTWNWGLFQRYEGQDVETGTIRECSLTIGLVRGGEASNLVEEIRTRVTADPTSRQPKTDCE
jgi:hypothetical protein